ncbi:MAG: hypothetical protein MRZ52_02240, partial [Oscillospiraceae bacterium]|nr:hypothetical protein [Oscillospiraceae bacterium]
KKRERKVGGIVHHLGEKPPVCPENRPHGQLVNAVVILGVRPEMRRRNSVQVAQADVILLVFILREDVQRAAGRNRLLV